MDRHMMEHWMDGLWHGRTLDGWTITWCGRTLDGWIITWCNTGWMGHHTGEHWLNMSSCGRTLIGWIITWWNNGWIGFTAEPSWQGRNGRKFWEGVSNSTQRKLQHNKWIAGWGNSSMDKTLVLLHEDLDWHCHNLCKDLYDSTGLVSRTATGDEK